MSCKHFTAIAEGCADMADEEIEDMDETVNFLMFLDACKTMNPAKIAALDKRMERKWARPQAR